MFDFRYHALSLSAVIVALVLGVLLGVAVGDRGLVSSGEKSLRKSLRSDIDARDQRIADLEDQLGDRKNVLKGVYPLLVGGQLEGTAIGVLFLGPKSQTDKDLINEALQPTGAQVSWVLALKEPLDVAGIGARAQGTQYAQLAQDATLYPKLGARIGIQLVDGGQLVTRERATLADSFDGKLAPVSTIVLVRDTPTGMGRAVSANVAAFETGVVAGLTQSNATVVGIQTQTTEPSQTAWYQSQGLTYVSDLDQIEGRISLIYALTGSTGAFGRGTGQQLLPDVTEHG
jgi:hypothetical protein